MFAETDANVWWRCEVTHLTTDTPVQTSSSFSVQARQSPTRNFTGIKYISESCVREFTGFNERRFPQSLAFWNLTFYFISRPVGYTRPLEVYWTKKGRETLCRGVYIPGATSPGRLNPERWRLVRVHYLWDLSMEIVSWHPSGNLNFKVAPTYLLHGAESLLRS